MTDSENEDWRLEAVIDHPAHGDLLDRIIQDSRTPPQGPGVAEGVVLTAGENCLFAYAADRATLDASRAALEAAIAREDLGAQIVISRWEEKLESWRQVEPPLSEAAEESLKAAELEADRPATRTVVATTGVLVRDQFEMTMLAAADRLGLECKIVEHRHLLTMQVAFTVSGPKHAVDEFELELKAEGRTMVRAQEEVGFSV